MIAAGIAQILEGLQEAVFPDHRSENDEGRTSQENHPDGEPHLTALDQKTETKVH